MTFACLNEYVLLISVEKETKQGYLEIQKDNKAFNEEPIQKKHFFFSQDDKPEFRDIKE